MDLDQVIERRTQKDETEFNPPQSLAENGNEGSPAFRRQTLDVMAGLVLSIPI
jgi:hypothetical protein